MRDIGPVVHQQGPMLDVWSSEGQLTRVLQVEAAVAKAHAELGNIPLRAAEEIAKKSNIGVVKWDEVRDADQRLHHTMMAVVKTLAGACDGDAGEYVHLAVGTSEITDTALALQMRDSLQLVRVALGELLVLMRRLIVEHQFLVIPGRSLGQQILPYSLGLRFGVWAAELCRHVERIDEIAGRVACGQIRGAVGSKAEQTILGSDTLNLEGRVLDELGLNRPVACDQILQRDRHTEYGWLLTSLALTLDKIAWNIRTLQRTEVGEVEEPFDDGDQVGSSDAPHKRNPRFSEFVCGLAHVVRGLFFSLTDAVRNEHERDSTGAVTEAYSLPEMSLSVYAMLDIMKLVIGQLRVDSAAAKENLRKTDGRIMSALVVLELFKRGVGRQSAHEIVRMAGQASFNQHVSFAEALLEDDTVKRTMTQAELREIVQPYSLVGNVEQQIGEILRTIDLTLSRHCDFYHRG